MAMVFGACLLPLAALMRSHAPPNGAFAQRAAPEEKVEKIDPYTRGQAGDLERAGYVSFGPFSLSGNVDTHDVEELAKLGAPQHMLDWSRVAWLMGLEQANLRGFLINVSEPLASGPSAAAEKLLVEQDRKALQAAFGKSPSELDDAWRKWVLKKYGKK